MSKLKLSALHLAIGSSLLSGLAFNASAAEDASAEEVERIEVTGSRLKRTDLEGALPVTVISREDLVSSGDVSLGEVLRNFPGNSQGSFTPRSGSSAQSTADISLRGLGSNRTLVLVNGKRLPSDALGGGSGQNLSLVPMAMVEKVEILQDGASSIYGSEAIAGVVNIILRKDFEGLQVNAQMSSPSRDGGGDEKTFSLVGGVSNDKGNITFAIEHKEVTKLMANERADTSANVDGWVGYSTNSDPANWRVTDFFNDGTNVNGPWNPDSRCDSNLISETPRVRTHPVTGEVTNVTDRECRFAYADVASWLPATKTDSIFINSNYNITDEVSLFAQASVMKLQSKANYAAIPLVAGFGMTVAADNEYNPTFGTDNPQEVGVKWRPQALGTRDFIVDTLQLDFLTGFTWSSDFGTLDTYVQWNKQDSKDTSRNYVLTSAVFDLIDSGDINPFGPAEDVEAATAQIRADAFREARVDLFVAGATWAADLPIELPGGDMAYSVGWEFRSEDFAETYDALTTSGSIFGGTGGPSGGGRDARSAYFEVALPVLDELVITYAGRYDEFTLPKDASEYTQSLRARYQAADSVVLRASYSEGFRVPDIDTLLQTGGKSTDQAIDRQACNQVGDPSSPLCLAGEIEAERRPGAETQPERSKSYAMGVVWDATEELNMTFDYFDVEIIDQISFLSTQAVLDLEATGVDPKTFNVDVERDGQGEILKVVNGYANLPGFQTTGMDFNISHTLRTDDFGDFRTNLNGTYTMSFDSESAPGLGVFDNVGFVSTPDLRAALSFDWMLNDMNAHVGINYTAGYDARTPEDKYLNDVGSDVGTLPSFTTVDASIGYTLPTNTKLILGARNLTDEISEPNAFAFGNGVYDRGLGEILGRVVYLSVNQTF
ncbi:TonB-dependent receptor [Pseudoalteromonas sp. NBT06-2]|uniref:TonB-dependent receptor plug domain-containing protein n=1 Tax=Pseudoalteromonas sp. NBT06-2 TaxID=2025950 RepID=UPI00148317FD|nr:TonB-dependent receptor [Pseudoalteromonas sp. NBT06-2]